MILKDLIRDIEVISIYGDTSLDIKNIAYNSKSVVKDSLFVAIKGMKFDGHNFVDEAVERGAKGLVLQRLAKKRRDICHIIVEDSRVALAKISSRFYHHPSQEVVLVGITGTNGKTTTAYLIESILQQADKKVGIIGTINYHYPQKTLKAIHTTPESLELQKILREMVDSGVSHVVMEVSSHALDLKRVDGCSFNIAVFTNLSRDHLDYHQDMTSYYKCKERLFTDLLEQSGELPWVVINHDDPKGKALMKVAKGRILTFGMSAEVDVGADGITCDLHGISAKIHSPQGTFEVTSRLLGSLNIYNILAATSVGITLKIPLNVIKKGIESVTYIPGRLKRVSDNHNIHVFVDYAHTSDALQRVLLALREIERGRIICVFGCGGDRDPGKRPLMGQVSGKLSDFTVITSDNPRTEDPHKIIAEIEKGIKQSKVGSYTIIPDRWQAIHYAIDLAKPGDVVLIAGKGHETYQILGNEIRPFDDTLVAKEALNNRKQIEGKGQEARDLKPQTSNLKL